MFYYTPRGEKKKGRSAKSRKKQLWGLGTSPQSPSSLRGGPCPHPPRFAAGCARTHLASRMLNPYSSARGASNTALARNDPPCFLPVFFGRRGLEYWTWSAGLLQAAAKRGRKSEGTGVCRSLWDRSLPPPVGSKPSAPSGTGACRALWAMKAGGTSGNEKEHLRDDFVSRVDEGRRSVENRKECPKGTTMRVPRRGPSVFLFSLHPTRHCT